MKRVLIANKDLVETKRLIRVISQQFNVSAINSPSEFNGDLQDINLMLVDCNITPANGIDFISEILKKSYFPILMVTPINNAKCAAEAYQAGAYNYIVKTRRYHEIVNIVIGEAIQRFDEYERMKQIIVDLKKKVAELEEQQAHFGSQGASFEKKPGGEPGRAREEVFNEIILRLKKGEINLPSPPQIQIQFEKLMQAEAGIQEIAKLLKQDVSISSKLISISNSALYQGITESRTLEQAIGRLGLNTTKKYIDVIYNRALYTNQWMKNKELMEKLWKHSISCALASQFTCEVTHVKKAEEVFTMGLIHDIGKLILLQIFAELDVITGEAAAENTDSDLAKALSLNHGAFGATLLKRWGFSSLFQQVALFHNSLESADSISKELLIVHFANLLAKSMGYRLEEETQTKIEEGLSARLLQISPATMSVIEEKVQQHMGELAAMF